jgi:hypothetical protein
MVSDLSGEQTKEQIGEDLQRSEVSKAEAVKRYTRMGKATEVIADPSSERARPPQKRANPPSFQRGASD